MRMQEIGRPAANLTARKPIDEPRGTAHPVGLPRDRRSSSYRRPMLTTASRSTVHGVDAYTIAVDVDVMQSQMVAFLVVDFSEAAVQESQKRVRRARKNFGCTIPARRIRIGLIVLAILGATQLSPGSQLLARFRSTLSAKGRMRLLEEAVRLHTDAGVVQKPPETRARTRAIWAGKQAHVWAAMLKGSHGDGSTRP
jgi:hypothetical protein